MEGSKEWGIRLILSPRKSGRQEGGREKAGGRQGGRQGGRKVWQSEPLVGHPDLASCNLGLLPELVLFFLFSFFKRVVPPFPLLAVDKPGYGSGLQVLPPVTGWDSSVPGPAGSGSGCADGQRASGSGQRAPCVLLQRRPQPVSPVGQKRSCQPLVGRKRQGSAAAAVFTGSQRAWASLAMGSWEAVLSRSYQVLSFLWIGLGSSLPHRLLEASHLAQL